MKRYLVYYDKKPIGGIDAIDYIDALNKAKNHTPPEFRKIVRVRYAKDKSLLWSLAQSNYPMSYYQE